MPLTTLPTTRPDGESMLLSLQVAGEGKLRHDETQPFEFLKAQLAKRHSCRWWLRAPDLNPSPLES
jgi:hypothetical protein